MKTVDIIGLRLACTDYSNATDWILNRAVNHHLVTAVEAANTHVAALSMHRSEFRG